MSNLPRNPDFDFNKWKLKLIELLNSEYYLSISFSETEGPIKLESLTELPKAIIAMNFGPTRLKEESEQAKAFALDFQKLIDKYPAVRTSIPEELESFVNKFNAWSGAATKKFDEYMANDTRKKTGPKKLPLKISLHILKALDLFIGNSKSLELLRDYLYVGVKSDFKYNLYDLHFSLPTVPQEQQDNTEWSRSLRRTLKKNISSYEG